MTVSKVTAAVDEAGSCAGDVMGGAGAASGGDAPAGANEEEDEEDDDEEVGETEGITSSACEMA